MAAMMWNGRAVLQLKKKKAKHKNLIAVTCLVQLNRLYSSKPPTIKQSHILFKPVTSLQTTGKQS